MQDVQDYIGRELPRFTDELFEFLRIPSVSADSRHDDDTHRAAEWLADRIRVQRRDDVPGQDPAASSSGPRGRYESSAT